MTSSRALVSGLLAVALLGVACSEETTSSPSSTEADVTAQPSAGASTTAASTTTTSTSSTTTTTFPPTTTTAAPTTSTSSTTTTTISRAQEELVLKPDGIGLATFGADPDGIVEYMSSILGSPSADTGWIDPFTFALCPGNEVRRVEWGVLSLLFSDDSTVASGRRHFFAWEYGLAGQIGDEPQGLRTAGGTTLGTRVVDLRAEFPEVAVNAGEDDGSFLPNFYVSDDFRGLLTGATDEDLVTVLFGGLGCGE
jgi:hypothetical protein